MYPLPPSVPIGRLRPLIRWDPQFLSHPLNRWDLHHLILRFRLVPLRRLGRLLPLFLWLRLCRSVLLIRLIRLHRSDRLDQLHLFPPLIRSDRVSR